MSRASLDQADGAPGDDALADVVRIRLSSRGTGTAFLGELHGADRVLAAWARMPGCGAVEWDITFSDGRVVRGSFDCKAKGRRVPAFSVHVRRLLRSLNPERQATACGPSQGAAPA